MLRLYVATAPDEAEESWRQQVLLSRLPARFLELGHWYRFPGSQGLIEVTEEMSGQWHPEGVLPDDVDPGRVIDVPAGEPVPTLLEDITTLLDGIPLTAANEARVTELRAQIADVGSPDRAKRLVTSFQQTLCSAPDVVEDRMRFLRQAAAQMVGTELLEGKATGYDVAGVLLMEAIAGQLEADEMLCRAVLSKAAAREASAVIEMALMLLTDCWYRGLQDKITGALDALRQRGEQVLEEARRGAYPEGHPEIVLDIYYGGILQAVPYLLATNVGYMKLKQAPASEGERAKFAKKANTSEEKLVRLRSALLYAVRDVDLSQLRDKQARVAAVLDIGDKERADQLVHEIIDLEFFYPSPFRSVLLGSAS